MAKVNFGEVVLWTGFFVAMAYVRNERRKKMVRDVYNQIIKKHPGYTVTACKDIYIEDANKAYRYAFDTGQTISNFDYIFVKLFDSEKCVETIAYTGETSQFFYNIIIFACAGAIKTGKLNIDGAVKALLELKSDFQKNGYDTSKWAIQDPKSYIEKLIKEY